MTTEYSVDVIRELEETFRAAALHRPMRVERYEPGTELVYDVTGVARPNRARVHLVVEKFVGGGFAGQVYRVRVVEVDAQLEPIDEIAVGGIYAIKILIPPTGFSRLFRNALYWLGFQGPFQLQLNPAAARSGALWQKFIRRGARACLGSESAVVDVHATFVDRTLGSCGELSEWVEGRTWRLEVDEHLDLLKRWRKGRASNDPNLGSPEYRAKYEFMHGFVQLLHEMGAHEFARQYEWSTWKSQPNCLKRGDTEGSPSEGLVAVDFRAGLTLLPFLPMSPGDFKLIAAGLARGSLVQFDRGDTGRLERFTGAHEHEFHDMGQMLGELKAAEQVYRESIPDITHNHVRLLYSSRLWSTMFDSAVTGWEIRDRIDGEHREKLRGNKALALLFFVVGAIPLLGPVLGRIWGQPSWRKHYRGMLSSCEYLGRAVRARAAERAISWHRSGRVDAENASRLPNQLWRYLYHLPSSLLPAGLHRPLTDWKYAKERLVYYAVRPVRLYFVSSLREQWLRDMVEEGRDKHLLTTEDAELILSQVDEPFVQKYLQSLAVHLCTLPVTQIVSVAVAITYILMHPEMPRGQAYAIGLGIVALFQVVPISPGSLTRGLYVVYLVIRERNFKDYNIAVFLGFFKYIGYLAFPIQMAYRYPALARFMAGHWATEAVHVVPVFGERGALLEHGIFSLFYNRPLTIRRRMRARHQARAAIRPRYWHIALCATAGSAIFGLVDFAYLAEFGELPGLWDIWPAAVIVPALCGGAVTLWAGGAATGKRVVGAAVCGAAIGVLYTFMPVLMGYAGPTPAGEMASNLLWRIFIATLVSTGGMLLTEIQLPEPRPS